MCLGRNKSTASISNIESQLTTFATNFSTLMSQNTTGTSLGIRIKKIIVDPNGRPLGPIRPLGARVVTTPIFPPKVA